MKPRYLVLTELFLPTKGGTAVWFDEVYRRLGDKTTHIVTADVPGAAEHDCNHPNTVHRLALHRVSWIHPESLLMYCRLFMHSFYLAATRRFAAIHAGRALPEGLVAWAVGYLTFHKVVIYAHGEELTTWGRGLKYKAMCFALRHANKVIANSEFTRDELIKMGVNVQLITLIYPGVDVGRFRSGLPCDDLKLSIGLKPNQKLILSVGRLSRRKGFDMVIRSLPVLLSKGLDVRFALIGIGEDMGYLKKLAQKLAVTDRVDFLGHVRMEDLPRWYNVCDVFAMPNREIDGDTEGFGLVFLEAAACGKPAIAGRAGGTGAAVLEGETGFRVDGTDERELIDRLEEFLTNPELLQRLGNNAHRRAVTEFTWESVAQRTNSLAVNRHRR
ncbi:MAG: glycosyltransferase family 4 protein [Thiobacillaceae bacterium]